MSNAARLSGIGTFYAFEFDDNTNTSFSVSAGSTAFSNQFDEDFSKLINARFDFRYHAFGGSINETTVYWYNETTSTLNTLKTISGQQHTSGFDEWDLYQLDLSSYAGETGRIVIMYSTGGDLFQDPALDEMQLFGTTSGTINLDPSNTQPNGGWEQQGGNSSTYPTSGYGALATGSSASNYWQYDTNGTPTDNTGPDQDYNNNGSSTPSGYYIYFEGSSPNNQTGIYAWLRTSSTYTLSNPIVNMGATSDGNIIVLDSINEVDAFDDIPTSNLELHLDASSGFTTTTPPTPWQDLSGNNRHMRITGDTNWDSYSFVAGSTTSGDSAYAYLEGDTTIQVGQSVVIPEIPSITGVGTFTYELYNLSGDGSLSGNGDITVSSVVQSPVVGPIGATLGTREFFRFGGSTNTKLRIPPQQVPYNAIQIAHIDDGTHITPAPSLSINNERVSVLNVPFESSINRLGVCDGNGSASAYTGVTGTAARTIILGVKFPASPATSYTAFSYGADATGQRFNIRLQSTGQIRVLFGSSYVQIPTTEIDDLNDFQLIAVTVPSGGTVNDVRVWLNGDEKTSQLTVNTGSTSINTSSANNVTIGGSSHGTVEYLDDSVITKVMIYSSVLSDLEIKQIYQSIIPDIYPFVERAS